MKMDLFLLRAVSFFFFSLFPSKKTRLNVDVKDKPFYIEDLKEVHHISEQQNTFTFHQGLRFQGVASKMPQSRRRWSRWDGELESSPSSKMKMQEGFIQMVIPPLLSQDLSQVLKLVKGLEK